MKEDKLKKIPKNLPVPIRNKPVGPSDNFWKDFWWIALLELSVIALLFLLFVLLHYE
nr:MAG TPA: chitin synthase regulator [Caudoviricetes sp.]